MDKKICFYYLDYYIIEIIQGTIDLRTPGSDNR